MDSLQTGLKKDTRPCVLVCKENILITETILTLKLKGELMIYAGDCCDFKKSVAFSKYKKMIYPVGRTGP